MAKDYVKPVKSLSFDFVFEDCPVEPVDGEIFSQVEDQSLYLSLRFKNMSDKPVEKMKAQILLYHTETANVPDDRLTLDYDLTLPPENFYAALIKPKKPGAAKPGEIFGEDWFFPVPESRFDRMEILIAELIYADGSRQSFNKLSTKAYSAMRESFGEFEKKAYERINVYPKLESKFPARVIPMENEKLWICCCGNKNSPDAVKCGVCGRDKLWQLKNLNMDAIEEKVTELKEEKSADVAFITKMTNRANAVPLSELQDRERIRREQVEAMKEVARQQKAVDRRKKIAAALVILWIAAALVVFFISR